MIFVFQDDFEYDGTLKCETKISVKDTISNNSPVYIIDYEHRIVSVDANYVIDSMEKVIKPCPFAYCSDMTKESYDGVTVIKNEMTSAMVKLMMMNDDELSNFTGLTQPQSYRKNIITTITQFWD